MISTLEDLRSIDLAMLNRLGLHRGRALTLTWSRAGRTTAEVEATADTLGLELFYRAGRVTTTQRIAWRWTDTPFGGRRRWLTCPSCSRACRVLYHVASGFLCRRCLGYGYASQQERGHHRALSMLQRIRRRLGGSASLAEPFPAKPVRMHWRKYQALRARCRSLEQRYVEGFTNVVSPSGARCTG
jgi:hypothetical protein